MAKALQPSHIANLHDARDSIFGDHRLLRKIILAMQAISPKERFTQYLENCGTKLSDDEARVVDVIWSIDGSFRDEDIVSKAGSEIEPAIVWRAIARLIAARLLTRSELNHQSMLVKAWPR